MALLTVKTSTLLASSFTVGFLPEGKICNFGTLFLRVVLRIETRPLHQQNQLLNFHEKHVAYNRYISDNFHPILVFG